MLGLTLARADRRKEAIEAFDQALRIEPGQAASHIAVARVHLLEGRLDRALEHARVAAEGESAEGLRHARGGGDASRPLRCGGGGGTTARSTWTRAACE